jgi:hypothetical protein
MHHSVFWAQAKIENALIRTSRYGNVGQRAARVRGGGQNAMSNPPESVSEKLNGILLRYLEERLLIDRLSGVPL